MLNTAEIVSLLKSHEIFSSLMPERLNALCLDERTSFCTVKAGESVIKGEDNTSLYMIVAGSVSVYRKGSGLPVLLQSLDKGRIFGVSSLFCGEENDGFITELKAESDCDLLVLPFSAIRELFTEDREFALAYVSFLSKKIRFLNKRISELSAPSILQKLAVYLLSESGNIASSKVKLASALGIGRASLYRALDELSEKGLIEASGSGVSVTDREGLKKLV